MPTRVVFDESLAARSSSTNVMTAAVDNAPAAEMAIPETTVMPNRRIERQHSRFRSSLMRSVVDSSTTSFANAVTSPTSNRVMMMRNSIFPEEREQQQDPQQQDPQQQPQQRSISTSATDIRASPRLTGYIYILIASIIMLASILRFYKNNNLQRAFDDFEFLRKERFVIISGTRVLLWKFIGAFLVACIGTSSSLLILLAHFDTFVLPTLWRTIFADGSRYERNLLLINAIFWIVGTHVSTSSFSIGATQANVYFTAWIALIASILNLDMWTLSAGYSSILDLITGSRTTTVLNWFYVLIFCFVSAGSVTDMYINRDYFVFYDNQGNLIVPVNFEWIQAILTAWGTVLLSGMVILFKVKFIVWKPIFSYLEGLLILSFSIMSAWACTTFTGVQGLILGPSNPYFGMWGVFFSSLATLGTWLRETDVARQTGENNVESQPASPRQ